MQALRETWLGAGAQLDPDGRPLHFGDPAAEFEAAVGSCVLIDRGHFGRLIGDGPDLLDLLNRLSTKAVEGLQPLDGRETVLTSNKGRIVARLWVHKLDDAVLLVAGPGQADTVRDVQHARIQRRDRMYVRMKRFHVGDHGQVCLTLDQRVQRSLIGLAHPYLPDRHVRLLIKEQRKLIGDLTIDRQPGQHEPQLLRRWGADDESQPDGNQQQRQPENLQARCKRRVH